MLGFLHRPRRIARPLAPRSRVQLARPSGRRARARADCGTRSRPIRSSTRRARPACRRATACSRARSSSGDAKQALARRDSTGRNGSRRRECGRRLCRSVRSRRGSVPARARRRAASSACRRSAATSIDVDDHVAVRGAALNARGARVLGAARRRPALGGPFREPAIEHRDRVVAEPAQQPPQPARVHAVVLVVRDDLHAARDAESAERLCKRVRIRQGMTPVRPTFGTREVVIRGARTPHRECAPPHTRARPTRRRRACSGSR